MKPDTVQVNDLEALSRMTSPVAIGSEKRLTGDRNQCQGCKQFFNSTFAFDKHRAGEHGRNRCCLPVAEMQAKGMEKNDAGFWVGSRMPDGIARSVPMGEDEEAYMQASIPHWGRA